MTLDDDENWLIWHKKGLGVHFVLSHTGSGNMFEAWFNVYFMVLHISGVVSNFPPKQNKKRKKKKLELYTDIFNFIQCKWSYICITFFEFYWYRVYHPGRSIFAISCCFSPLFGGAMFLCVSDFGSIYLFRHPFMGFTRFKDVFPTGVT